jgi:exodeoxyribonuclease III
MNAVRVATFNVNSINARLKFLLHWLAARQPDVVCLQELKVTAEEFPYDALREAGYHACVHGQKGWNGVAVLGREPPQLLCAGLPDSDLGARFVSARAGKLTVASVYVPNGKSIVHPDFAAKLAFFQALRDQLKSTLDPAAPVLVGGDFNVCHTALDTYDPELADTLFHTDPERRAVDALLELGLVDLYRDLCPEGRAFSWWDYRAGNFHKGLGLRIDLLLGTRAVREITREVWVDRDYRKKKEGETPSDHAPVIAELA